MTGWIRRSALARAIGNTVEWFDFAVYGYFAKEIGEAFFPADVPSLQPLSAFAVFAMGYLMRPIGGLLLGPIGDLVGRRALLLISVAVMAACSLGIALLPPTSAWGPASAVLLVLLRLLQGLSAVSFYAATVFAVQEVSARLPALAARFNGITTLNQAIGVGLILLGGHLADRRTPVALARRLSLMLAVAVLPGMLLIATGTPLAFGLGQLIVLVPLMLYLGVYPSLLPGLFPAAQRCSAFSFSYSLVVALLGGTLPLVATWLEASLGLTQGPALYCLIWAVPTLLAYRQLERHLLPDEWTTVS